MITLNQENSGQLKSRFNEILQKAGTLLQGWGWVIKLTFSISTEIQPLLDELSRICPICSE